MKLFLRRSLVRSECNLATRSHKCNVRHCEASEAICSNLFGNAVMQSTDCFVPRNDAQRSERTRERRNRWWPL